MFEPYRYFRPSTIGEASRLLAFNPTAMLLAGGTDLLVKMRERAVTPGAVVDLKGIPELRSIRRQKHNLHLGALSTVSDILVSGQLAARSSPSHAGHPPPPSTTAPTTGLGCLLDAARSFACFEIRNRATLGGNLANASPGADLSVCLVALDAVALVAGHDSPGRRIPLADFFRGPGRTALEPGEILLGVEVPQPEELRCSAYQRLSRTTGMDLASVGIAVVQRRAPGTSRPRISLAMGAVAPTPIRSPAAEAILNAAPITPSTAVLAGEALTRDLSPRASSLRASPEYKLAVLPHLLARALGRMGLLAAEHMS